MNPERPSHAIVRKSTITGRPLTEEEIKDEIPWGVWSATFLITTQSLLFGYALSSINTTFYLGDDHNVIYCRRNQDETCPIGTGYRDVNLSSTNMVSLGACIMVGGLIGAVLANYPADKYGRKTTMLWNQIFIIIGSAFASSGNRGCLFFGRFVLGIGLGVISVVVPVWLSELCQDHYRGVITTMHEVMIALGLFWSVIWGGIWMWYVVHGWQYIQAMAIVPSVLLLVMKDRIPESPKWLLSQGSGQAVGAGGSAVNPMMNEKPTVYNPSGMESGGGSLSNAVQTHQEALTILKSLRAEDFESEYEMKRILAENKDDTHDQMSLWKELFANKKALVMGCGLFFFNAASGINTLLFYSYSIFELEGYSNNTFGWGVFAFMFLVMAMAASRLSDSTGRRPLLITGTILQCGGLLAAGAICIAGADPVFQGIMSVLGMIVNAAGYGLGLGSCVWPIMTEILPTRLKAKAGSLFVSIYWLVNIIVASIVVAFVVYAGNPQEGDDDLSDDYYWSELKVGVGWLYFMYAMFCFIAVFYIYIFVRETKEKSLQQINKMYMAFIQPRNTLDLSRESAARASAVLRNKSYSIN